MILVVNVVVAVVVVVVAVVVVVVAVVVVVVAVVVVAVVCDNFIGIKTLQREFASATIATLVELNKWLKFSTSKQLYQPDTVIKNGKTCNEKNRITDRHIKRDDSRKKS